MLSQNNELSFNCENILIDLGTACEGMMMAFGNLSTN